MRLALMTAALMALTACEAGPDAAGPERRNAAGEVLGGEVTDDMLPLDTLRSTSPADTRGSAPGANGASAAPAAAAPAPPSPDGAEASSEPAPDTNAAEDPAPPAPPPPQ